MTSTNSQINEHLERIIQESPLVPETLLRQCPYDKSHTILSKHFQTHIIKCGKNYKNVVKWYCAFNVCHIFTDSDSLALHMKHCENRYTYDRYDYTLSDNQNVKVPKVIVPPTEMWDDETTVSGYQNHLYSETDSIYRT
ncbi:gametocyte-specific factor 1 homolog [Teleopsis dalmanni]|uniref:gametocyte-specific factor 1 homolog n=1 Tax=Teleopsis dalmanni TaxID=139649 RepID=UPI0018CE6D1A|nr:gametocyte-specific factor 1 homolog [Teleopsis dalmanni]XP_037938840.1 gametocyte-specific factor 1 homolog [Teleopsis dalmanni]